MPTGITLAGRGSLRADGKVYNCTKIDPAIGNEKREKVAGLGTDVVKEVLPTGVGAGAGSLVGAPVLGGLAGAIGP